MKIFLFCLLIFFDLNKALKLQRESLKDKQRKLGLEDQLEQMSLESSDDGKNLLEDHIMDLMYGGTRFENRLLTKQIVHQKLDQYYERIEFWLHSIVKKMNHIKRKANKKINEMAIGIERRNMLLQRFIQQKEQAAKEVSKKLEEIHQKRLALENKKEENNKEEKEEE